MPGLHPSRMKVTAPQWEPPPPGPPGSVWEMMAALGIAYVPTARQLAFHESKARYRLYGGAVAGGKSLAILMDAIAQCLTIPNWTALILRRTRPELEQNQISRFRAMVPPKLYTWKDRDKTATFQNGSSIRFGYLDVKGDETIYMSDEYGAIYFDELTHFDMFPWSFMKSRNRSTAGGKPNMAGGTNPGSRGHVWVKKLWVEREPAPGMEAHEYDSSEYEFIPAKISDNPHILAANPEYLKTLESLPFALRMAMLDGSWDIHAGQFFDNFDREAHVKSDIKLETWWPKWVGIDWGYRHGCAAYWACQKPDGKISIYREMVVREKPVADIANLIAELSENEKIEAVYLSPDAFAKRSEERSIAERFGDAFVLWGIPAPTHAVNDRVNGWRYLHDLFSRDGIELHSSCKYLIDKLPRAIIDDKHPEDVLKQDGDDEIDALRYAVMSRSRSNNKPYAVQIAERVTAEEPTARALQARIAARDIGREGSSFRFFNRRTPNRTH